MNSHCVDVHLSHVIVVMFSCCQIEFVVLEACTITYRGENTRSHVVLVGGNDDFVEQLIIINGTVQVSVKTKMLAQHQIYHAKNVCMIGSFGTNPWGLNDTSGNVAEWTLDCYNKNYNGAPINGSAWQDGDCSKRVVRGGSFSNAGNGISNTRREKYNAGSKLSHIGFRVVREK